MKLTVRKMAILALMSAMSILLKLTFSIYITPDLKIVFHNIPIIIVSILFNPLYGGLVALITDLVSIISTPYWSPIFTLPQLFWGITPGLFFLFKKKVNPLKLILAEYSAYLSVSALNFLAFWITYDLSYSIARLPNTLLVLSIKAPVDIIIIYLLFRNFFNKRENLIEK